MAARHLALDDGANSVLERVEFGRQVEVQVQAAMVHALQADDDLTLPSIVFRTRAKPVILRMDCSWIH